MTCEKIQNFDFRLWIKDKKSEEIIELNKNEDLEVRWDGSWGKAKKVVVFEKDGKKYQIGVLISLKEHLLGTRYVVGISKFTTPPEFSYEVYKGYMGEPDNSPEKDRERQEIVKLTNQWNVGRIVIFLIIIVVVFAFVFWMFKKKKRVKNKH